jgi:hypothetical protein
MGVLGARAVSRIHFPVVDTAVKQRAEAFEQGGNLLVVEQSRGDEELAGPTGDERGVAFDDPLDFIDHRIGGGGDRTGIHRWAFRRQGRWMGFRSHALLLTSSAARRVRRLFSETLP